MLLFTVIGSITHAQSRDESYRRAFQKQLQMLDGQKTLSFKRAVFLTENAHYGDKLNYQAFCQTVMNVGNQLKRFKTIKQESCTVISLAVILKSFALLN